MLSVILLSVAILSFVMWSVMWSVTMLNVIRLCVVAPTVSTAL
jgi:hypothetical protein